MYWLYISVALLEHMVKTVENRQYTTLFLLVATFVTAFVFLPQNFEKVVGT